MEYELELHIVIKGLDAETAKVIEEHITEIVKAYGNWAATEFEIGGGVSKMEVPDGEETS